MVEHGLTIRIFDPSGNLIQAYGPYRNASVDPQALAASRSGKANFSTFVDRQAEDTIRAYTAPILENRKVIAIIQVSQGLSSIHDTLDSLLTTILWVIPLIVIVAGMGG